MKEEGRRKKEEGGGFELGPKSPSQNGQPCGRPGN